MENHVELKQLTDEQIELLRTAKEAGKRHLNKKGTRYVGAALLGGNGKTYLGSSIRRTNASNSTCGERMAIDRAIFDKCYQYKLLAIVGFHKDDKTKEILAPCGACRQILSEAESYGKGTTPIDILLANQDLSEIIRTSSSKLFPIAYREKR